MFFLQVIIYWGSPQIQEKWYGEADKLIEGILVNWSSSSVFKPAYVGKYLIVFWAWGEENAQSLIFVTFIK